MGFELTGKLVEIYDTQQVTDTFKKREFVVETEETSGSRLFVEHIKFQSIQDRTSILDPFKVEDIVTVSFNIKGKRWEKNGQVSYFNNLDAWRIEKAAEENTDSHPGYEEQIPPPDFEGDDSQQLPF